MKVPVGISLISALDVNAWRAVSEDILPTACVNAELACKTWPCLLSIQQRMSTLLLSLYWGCTVLGHSLAIISLLLGRHRQDEACRLHHVVPLAGEHWDMGVRGYGAGSHRALPQQCAKSACSAGRDVRAAGLPPKLCRPWLLLVASCHFCHAVLDRRGQACFSAEPFPAAWQQHWNGWPSRSQRIGEAAVPGPPFLPAGGLPAQLAPPRLRIRSKSRPTFASDDELDGVGDVAAEAARPLDHDASQESAAVPSLDDSQDAQADVEEPAEAVQQLPSLRLFVCRAASTHRSQLSATFVRAKPAFRWQTRSYPPLNGAELACPGAALEAFLNKHRAALAPESCAEIEEHIPHLKAHKADLLDMKLGRKRQHPIIVTPPALPPEPLPQPDQAPRPLQWDLIHKLHAAHIPVRRAPPHAVKAALAQLLRFMLNAWPGPPDHRTTSLCCQNSFGHRTSLWATAHAPEAEPDSASYRLALRAHWKVTGNCWLRRA